jgi:hypothetical protein
MLLMPSLVTQHPYPKVTNAAAGGAAAGAAPLPGSPYTTAPATMPGQPISIELHGDSRCMHSRGICVREKQHSSQASLSCTWSISSSTQEYSTAHDSNHCSPETCYCSAMHCIDLDRHAAHHHPSICRHACAINAKPDEHTHLTLLQLQLVAHCLPSPCPADPERSLWIRIGSRCSSALQSNITRNHTTLREPGSSAIICTMPAACYTSTLNMHAFTAVNAVAAGLALALILAIRQSSSTKTSAQKRSTHTEPDQAQPKQQQNTLERALIMWRYTVGVAYGGHKHVIRLAAARKSRHYRTYVRFLRTHRYRIKQSSVQSVLLSVPPYIKHKRHTPPERDNAGSTSKTHSSSKALRQSLVQQKSQKSDINSSSTTELHSGHNRG